MPVLEVVGSQRIRPTRDTHNLIRKKAAQNGYAVGDVKNDQECIEAIIKGLPDSVVERLTEFIEADKKIGQ